MLHRISCGRVVLGPVIPRNGDIAGGYVEDNCPNPWHVFIACEGELWGALAFTPRNKLLPGFMNSGLAALNQAFFCLEAG